MDSSLSFTVNRILRVTRIFPVYDFLKYLRHLASMRRPNRDFGKERPGEPMPPSWWMWDAHAHVDHRRYFEGGRSHARQIVREIEPHLEAALERDGPYRILEWGCGNARIVRHLPSVAGERNVEVYGADYNEKMISWCRENVQDVRFEVNGLSPPLSQPDDSFDLVYCQSVFTHLSEARHVEWAAELLRVLRPGGLLLASFHGENFIEDLSRTEREEFDAGRMVVRGGVKEGRKLYAAYHPEAFIRQLLRSFDIEEIRVPPRDRPGSKQTLAVAVKPS